MRIVKLIPPVAAALVLSVVVQAARADGLLNWTPGACKPVQKVDLPPACEPVKVFAPPVKACEPVQASRRQ